MNQKLALFKGKAWLAFIATIALTAFTNSSPKESYTIDGEVNVERGTVYLQSFRNKMFFVIDSAQIENGKFHFSGTVDRPDLYGLTLNREESFSPAFLFIENKPITVKLDTEDRRNYEVTGSATQDIYTTYLKADKRNFDLDAFVAANPASVATAYILYREYSYRLNEDEIEKYLQQLDPSLMDTEYVKVLQDHVQTLRKVAVGNPAPDFASFTPEGETVSLSDYTGKGYLLLDFWASWCGPCRRENPNLVKAYEDYHAKGFDIFAVSLDQKRESWLEGIQKDGLPWTQVSDLLFWDSAPAKLYGVRAIPANFLIDPDGIIIARNLRGEELLEKLKDLF